MALRLKVNRSALIQQCEEALASIASRIEKVKQEEAAWDWRVSAQEAVERLTNALVEPGMTAETFDNLWYTAKREKPYFQGGMRHDKLLRFQIQTLLEALKLNKEEDVSISTGDEAIAGVLREAKKAATRA